MKLSKAIKRDKKLNKKYYGKRKNGYAVKRQKRIQKKNSIEKKKYIKAAESLKNITFSIYGEKDE